MSQLALPAAAAPAPRRQLFIGTAVACVAGTMMIGSMLALWALLRGRYLSDGFAGEAVERFPVKYIIPEVATNVMLMTVWALCMFAQWAVYAGNRGDRGHTALGLGVSAVMAIAFINAQAFVYADMGVVIDETYYGTLFYAITGSMLALVMAGLVFTTVAAFRALSGRLGETEILSAHALYWYFIAVAFSAVWFAVYVTK